MFVDDRPWVARESEHFTRIAHGERECASFRCTQSSEINRHEQRRNLVIGNCAGGAALDEVIDLFGGESFAVALRFDQLGKVQADDAAEVEELVDASVSRRRFS